MPNRALREKITVAQQLQNIPCLLWQSIVPISLHNSPTLISIFQCAVYNSPVLIDMLREKHAVHNYNIYRNVRKICWRKES